MAKEVLIYSDIQSWTAANFINDVNEVEGDLVVRVDSNGGDPQSTYGMIAKYREFEGNKNVKIDGRAYSSAFFFAAMVDNVEALSVSSFMIHRAAYPDWYEAEYMTDEQRSSLEAINKDLKKGFESKVDIAMFEEIAGITVKEIFSMDDRKNVFLSAKQAKKIGLINKITPINSAIKAQLESNMAVISARYTPTIESNKKEVVINKKIEIMTIDEVKANPEFVSAILADEKDRVGSWLKFVDVDAKAVSEGINSGNKLSQTAMAEFAIKLNSSATLKKVEDNAAPIVAAIVTDPVIEETELEKVSASLMNSLK